MITKNELRNYNREQKIIVAFAPQSNQQRGNMMDFFFLFHLNFFA